MRASTRALFPWVGASSEGTSVGHLSNEPVAFLLALITSVSALAPTMVSTSPFGKIAIPRKGSKSPKSAIPDEDKPLTERLGGVGVTKVRAHACHGLVGCSAIL